MDPRYDVQAIADRLGLPARQVRYVLDHRVLPGDRVEGAGRGHRRTFDAYEAFGVAVAALMIAAGLKRALVADVFDLVCGFRGQKVAGHPNFYLGYNAVEGKLEVANGEYVRISGTKRPGVTTQDVDTGWLPISAAESAASQPIVLAAFVIDLAAVRALFK